MSSLSLVFISNLYCVRILPLEASPTDVRMRKARFFVIMNAVRLFAYFAEKINDKTSLGSTRHIFFSAARVILILIQNFETGAGDKIPKRWEKSCI